MILMDDIVLIHYSYSITTLPALHFDPIVVLLRTILLSTELAYWST